MLGACDTLKRRWNFWVFGLDGSLQKDARQTGKRLAQDVAHFECLHGGEWGKFPPDVCKIAQSTPDANSWWWAAKKKSWRKICLLLRKNYANDHLSPALIAISSATDVLLWSVSHTVRVMRSKYVQLKLNLINKFLNTHSQHMMECHFMNIELRF